MKIGYFADGPWSHLALEKIVAEDCLEIGFIVPRYKYQDPILREWSKKIDIEFLPIQNINEPKSLEKLRQFNCDIFVSMSFNQIFKSEILNLTPNGFINCHASALPFYRGRNNLNWVLINDEKEFGVTVHHIDEGIDTGDIILQRKYPITDKDDYQTLLERAKKHCADILYDSLCLIEKGDAERIDQNSIDPEGSYSRRRVVGDEWVDWSKSSREIFNFIRGITTPGPLARSKVDEEIVYFISSSAISPKINKFGERGEILEINNNDITIKTSDGSIKVKITENSHLNQSFLGKQFN
jgi:methionyl-tRNA formyltransferase